MYRREKKDRFFSVGKGNRFSAQSADALERQTPEVHFLRWHSYCRDWPTSPAYLGFKARAIDISFSELSDEPIAVLCAPTRRPDKI